jgi:hypothetical protein
VRTSVEFSTQHVTGEQLQQLTGVVAVLHYPIQEIKDEEDDAEEQAESEVQLNYQLMNHMVGLAS